MAVLMEIMREITELRSIISVSDNETGVVVRRQPQVDPGSLGYSTEEYSEWTPWLNDTGSRTMYGATIFATCPDDSTCSSDRAYIDSATIYVCNDYYCQGELGYYEHINELGWVEFPTPISVSNNYWVAGHAYNDCDNCNGAKWNWAAYLWMNP